MSLAFTLPSVLEVPCVTPVPDCVSTVEPDVVPIIGWSVVVVVVDLVVSVVVGAVWITVPCVGVVVCDWVVVVVLV